MAGIGFRLQKLLKGESYTDLVRAYVYSAIITTGPLLLFYLTFSLVKLSLIQNLSQEEKGLFLALTVYIFAFSLMGTGPFVYLVTRYLADQYYLKNRGAFTPTYLGVLEMLFIAHGLIGIAYLWSFTFDLQTKFYLLSAFLFVTGTWMAMIFMTAAKNYKWIFYSFILAGILQVVSAHVLGPRAGFQGYAASLALGQGSLFMLLTVQILREFGFDQGPDFTFLSQSKKYAALVGTGVFYYTGLWIDKFVFWFSQGAQHWGPRLVTYVDYDLPHFMATLTILPSMAFFMIQMETGFSVAHNRYFKSIGQRENYEGLMDRKNEMVQILRERFKQFVIFQGLITTLVIIFVVEIGKFFLLTPIQMGVFRISILGAFLQMGFLMMLNVLFYFDFKRETMFLCLLNLISNFVLSFLTLQIGLPAYGFGFAGASFLSLTASYLVLNQRLNNLEYWVFMRQPLMVPRFKLEGGE